MIEQDSVTGIHPIALAVVHRDPVRIELGYPIRTAGIKLSALLLRCFLHQSIKLTCTGLVDACFICKAKDPYRFQDPQHAQSIAICGVLRTFKTNRHMALGSKVIDLIGLHLLDDPN